MNSNDCIEQKGIIDDIKSGIARVVISSLSACGSCHSQSSCHAGEVASKEIEVYVGDADFHKGEMVSIQMQKSLGLTATLFAYLLPFVIMVTTLIVLTESGQSELRSGLMSILVLVPYFIVIYLFKNKLRKKFHFTLKKVS